MKIVGLFLCAILCSSVTLLAQPKKYDIGEVVYDPILGAIQVDLEANQYIKYTDEYELGNVYPKDQLSAQNVKIEGNRLILSVTDKFEPGIFTFQVNKKGEEGANHLLSLKVKSPKPALNVRLNQEGRSGDLFIEYNKQLKVNMALTGGPFYHVPEVTFQGIKVKVNKVALNELSLNLEASGEELKKFELGNQPLQIRTADWPKLSVSIPVNAASPIISQALPMEYSLANSLVPLKVRADAVSPNATLCVECLESDKCFVDTDCYPTSVDSEGFIQSNVRVKLNKYGDKTRINVSILNGDGSRSKPVEVDVLPLNLTATVELLDDTRPLIEGVSTKIIINSPLGDFSISNLEGYKLVLNDLDDTEVPIHVSTSSSPRRLFVSADIPISVFGSKMKFTLSKNGSSWSGRINRIYEQPKFINVEKPFRRGITYTLKFSPKVTGANISSFNGGVEVIDGDVSDGVGQIKFAEEAGDEVIVNLKINQELVTPKKFVLFEWKQPENAFDLLVEDTTRIGDRLVFRLDPNSDFVIKPKLSFIDSTQSISVQLYKKDGTALGNKETLRFRNNMAKTIPVVGLNPGEEFRIEFSNAGNKRTHYIGYVKRPFEQRWLLSAGLNGLRYELKDDDNQETIRHNILGGITTGAFYLFENKKPKDTRFVGVGLYGNFIENSTKDDIKGSFGLGLLLAERLLVGVDLGKNKAITIGANFSILDFAKVIGSKDTSDGG